MLTITDVSLRAINDKFIAITDGGSTNTLQIRTGIGFGHGDGAYVGARCHARQPSLLLLVVAVMQEVRSHNLAVHLGAKARGTSPQLLFQNDRLMTVVTAGSAVLGRYLCQQKTCCPGFTPSITINDTLGFPRFLMRRKLGGEKFPGCVSQHGQFIVHPG